MHKLPGNLFTNLKISFQRLLGNEDRLPAAHTCIQQLDMPSYDSK